MKKRILYVAATTRDLYYDMLPFMDMMDDKGYIAEAAAGLDDIAPYLVQQPCVTAFHPIEMPGCPFSPAGWRAYSRIKKLLADKWYHLVHTDGLVPSLLTTLAARDLSGTRVVYMARGLSVCRGASLLDRLVHFPMEHIVCRMARDTVTVNLEDYVCARRLFPHTRVHYIPSTGIDLYEFQPMHYMRAGHKVILCIGAMTRRHNQTQVLRAIPHLLDIMPGFKVWFLGEGPMLARYQDLARRLDVQDHVEWLPNRRDIKTLLFKSDIVVSASRSEGVSQGLLMAMACAKPIVATDIRGHRELIAEGVNGYIVPLGDAKALAQACARLLQNPDILEMGGASRILSLKYDIEYIKQRMAVIYGV